MLKTSKLSRKTKTTKTFIIAGHYGVGKTNLAVNLALFLANSSGGETPAKITVADLDIVNPFFRTADFKKLFGDNNIRLCASDYANSNLDIPALNLDVKGELSRCDHLIIDLGGDGEGAKVLGRFSESVCEHNYEMIYVINKYRPLTDTPEKAVEIMGEIEAKTGNVKSTAIFNNSHLGTETTPDIMADSHSYADEVSKLTGLPLVELPTGVDVYVKPLWQI